jgi:hypothetical protein
VVQLPRNEREIENRINKTVIVAQNPRFGGTSLFYSGRSNTALKFDEERARKAKDYKWGAQSGK